MVSNDQMKTHCYLENSLGNIYDNVSAQLNKTYDKGQVICIILLQHTVSWGICRYSQGNEDGSRF